jgi:hypothetical protein
MPAAQLRTVERGEQCGALPSRRGADTLAGAHARWEDERVSQPGDTVRLGAAIGGLGLSGVARVAAAGARVERRARDAVGNAASRAALSALGALLESRFADEALERMLESPGMDRLSGRAIESPAAERLVGRVIQSPLLDEAVGRLLESEDLWLLVDEVARSPAVTEAIGSQGLGFADQVAEGVRARSLRADDRLEHAARRLLRYRRERAAAPKVGEDGAQP